MKDFVNLTIDTAKNEAEYNGITINKDFSLEVNKLIDIFSNWKKYESNAFVLDAEKLELEVINNNESQKIQFCGNYPSNYKDFKTILKEIIKCF